MTARSGETEYASWFPIRQQPVSSGPLLIYYFYVDVCNWQRVRVDLRRGHPRVMTVEGAGTGYGMDGYMALRHAEQVLGAAAPLAPEVPR